MTKPKAKDTEPPPEGGVYYVRDDGSVFVPTFTQPEQDQPEPT